MASYTQISDNPVLLTALKSDSARQPAVYVPLARWADYSRRILDQLERRGLHDFRTNHQLLKGYADAGFLTPTLPVNPLKRAIWKLLENTPPISSIVFEYNRLLKVANTSKIDIDVSFSLLVLDEIKAEFPNLRVPQGLASGGAATAFEWQGNTVTTDWVQMLSRAADFYRAQGSAGVSTILEIGGGIGLSTLAHIALNENLEVVINLDLPYVTYVCGQYLKSFSEIELIDYLHTRNREEIEVERSASKRVRVYQLPGWQIERLRGEVDLFLNASSFQEMPLEICENYIRYAKAITSHYVLLHCGDPRIDTTSDPLEGNHVSARELVSLFSDRFPNVSVLEDGWCRTYRVGGYRAVILSKD